MAKTKFKGIIPVLPTSDMQRDIKWYKENAGFTCWDNQENMYALLNRENINIHLQWHADSEDDPLLGGSVIKIFVQNLKPLFDEFVERGTVLPNRLRMSTPWNTNEFGFFDLNKNAIFFVEDID